MTSQLKYGQLKATPVVEKKYNLNNVTFCALTIKLANVSTLSSFVALVTKQHLQLQRAASLKYHAKLYAINVGSIWHAIISVTNPEKKNKKNK